MKILIIGGTGTIGKYLTSRFSKSGYDVFVAHRNSEEYPIDLESATSILKLFQKVGICDAIICVAGEARWADFEALTEEDFFIGLRSKLMGQVNVVKHGKDFLSDPSSSITLTTGILADHPVLQTTSAAMVNGGIHSFVKAVALELRTHCRVNVVSSGLVEDAYEKYKDYFPGHVPVSMDRIYSAYAQSVLGSSNGDVIKVY
jgi:NAD(P)-dependent dehydrogenase (short-subunit alcohol dehydrogenase family)